MVGLEEAELKVITQFLINRVVAIRQFEISTDGTSSAKNSPFSLVKNVDLLNKIQSRIIFGFSSKELCIIHSCINEYLPGLEAKVIFSQNTRWFSVTEEERNIMQTIDLCRGILTKTGYYKKYGNSGHEADFSFKKVMEVLDKIRQSSKILMHTTSDGRVYRLAFVFKDNEILKIRADSRLNITDLDFNPLPNESLERYAYKTNAVITGRKEAVSILEKSPLNFFPLNAREFIMAMLH